MFTILSNTRAAASFRGLTSVICAICMLLSAAGCSDDPWLRDDYFGMSWLEPDRVIQPVIRDAYGNAIVEPKKKK